MPSPSASRPRSMRTVGTTAAASTQRVERPAAAQRAAQRGQQEERGERAEQEQAVGERGAVASDLLVLARPGERAVAVDAGRGGRAAVAQPGDLDEVLVDRDDHHAVGVRGRDTGLGRRGGQADRGGAIDGQRGLLVGEQAKARHGRKDDERDGERAPARELSGGAHAPDVGRVHTRYRHRVRAWTDVGARPRAPASGSSPLRSACSGTLRRRWMPPTSLCSPLPE